MKSEKFIKALVKARIEKGIPQAKFAAKLGICRDSLLNYETEKREPGYKLLEKWCKALGFTLKMEK
jgi:transcriptional regulator with XRE-family HTH domain